MEIIKGDFSRQRDFRPAGYASGSIAPAPFTRKWSPSMAIISPVGRSDQILISLL
jgi:hypothetical protein